MCKQSRKIFNNKNRKTYSQQIFNVKNLDIANKHTSYRGEDCMKKFCESLREHPKNVIDFEKKNVTVNKTKLK